MKIPLLLIRYFYQTKRLSLPGLGIFTLDKNTVIPQESENQGEVPNGAQFQKVAVASAEPELIAFISENTGKIKPLATADLESFLGLGIEMLNIGKPFLLEGIGTISRSPKGIFEFNPGFFGLMPLENRSKDPKNSPEVKKTTDSIKAVADSTSRQPGMAMGDHRNLLRAVALVAGMLIIGGGGYLMYRNRSAASGFSDSTVAVAGLMNEEDKAASPAPAKEPFTNKAVVYKPVVETAAPLKPADSAELKFVILSTPNKAHALRRYNQLLSFDLKARLFEKDSAWFKVYFAIPAKMKDTVHIKDSLRRQYDANVSIDR